MLNLAGGDKFGANFQYAKGAAGYGSAGGSWFLLNPGQSAAIGLMADGIFGPGGEISQSTVWNAIAFYEHRWNARWKTSLFGGYVDISYDGNAEALINQRFPATAGTLVCGVPLARRGRRRFLMSFPPRATAAVPTSATGRPAHHPVEPASEP